MKKLIIEIDRDKFVLTIPQINELIDKQYQKELKKELQRLVKVDAVKQANIIYKNFGGK